jgi:hypothetical protein
VKAERISVLKGAWEDASNALISLIVQNEALITERDKLRVQACAWNVIAIWLRGDPNRTLTATAEGLCASQLEPGQSAAGHHHHCTDVVGLALLLSRRAAR